ncbi:hypothetical protein BGZ52_002560 [Haplosporangium bisporale]|nr:hypothetical protein BGZ52_002560 [Haplosporangium bisporale]
MHEQGHPSHNPYGHHRRASSPPHNAINGAPGGSPLAPGPGVPNSNDVLQKTRQDLQREVTNLSMLLGRAAAVLSGLDQALDPHNAGATGSPPGPHHIMQVNVHTPHENGSPVHGYNHGGHGNHIHASHNHGHGHPPSASMTPPTSMPSDMTTNSALASLMALGSSGGPAHPVISGTTATPVQLSSYVQHVFDQILDEMALKESILEALETMATLKDSGEEDLPTLLDQQLTNMTLLWELEPYLETVPERNEVEGELGILSWQMEKVK